MKIAPGEWDSYTNPSIMLSMVSSEDAIREKMLKAKFWDGKSF